MSTPGGRLRGAWLALGILCTGIGVAAAFIPLLPSTIFLIVALWAFARSSPRFHRWLFTHPRFGPPLQAWYAHRVVSRRAKIAAVATMSLSVAVVALTTGKAWVTLVVVAVLVPVALWLSTRRERPPAS